MSNTGNHPNGPNASTECCELKEKVMIDTSRRLTVVYMRLALPAQMLSVKRRDNIWIFRTVEGRIVLSTGSNWST
jgi:hypothetical protein